jgi:ArsR family metal-binding transcriptional regulator
MPAKANRKRFKNRTMFLNTIVLTRTLPCLAEPGKVIVIGKPDRTLEEVIPYLATLPGVIAYNPATRTLTFRRPRGFITLYADKVYITQVNDTAEGLELLGAIKDAINAVWEKREELVAVTKSKSSPRHLDLWALLPQTNCKQCGEATCLAFAVLLIQQNRSLEECIPIQKDTAFTDRRTTLEALLA